MANSKESKAPNRLNSWEEIKAAWSAIAKYLDLSSEDAETLSKSGATVPKSVLKMIRAGEKRLSKEPAGSPAEMDGAKELYKLIEKNRDKKKVKKTQKIPKPRSRPTKLKYSSDTGEGGEKQKKARNLRGSRYQDTGESPHKKSDIKTAGMPNKVSSDQGKSKSKPKPTKAKWKVEYGKITDEAQEEQNLYKGGSVKYKSKMKKGGFVTKRGPIHRSSKRKS